MWSPIASINRSPYKLALLSGILLIVSQPPLSLSPLAYVALVPLLMAVEGRSPRVRFILGMVTGVAAYLGLVYWVIVAMNTYGGISVPLSIVTLLLLVLYLALYTGLFAWAVHYLDVARSVPVYLGAPLVWVLLEYVRGFLLSGFPWSYLAHSQSNILPLIQVTSVTGTYFLSFLIVSVNVLLSLLALKKHVPRLFAAAVAILVAGSLVYGFIRLAPEHEKAGLTVSIVQGNIRQDVKWNETFKAKTIDTYARLTLEGGSSADLVVWPETAMPFIFDRDAARTKISSLAGQLRNHLLLGSISVDDRGRHYNSAYLLGKAGEIVGVYNKRHLVPFGEFTPLRDYFPFLERISVHGGEFFPGHAFEPIHTSVGNIGMLICYEGVFPHITNETVRRGAGVLVNITNDAWFGKSSAPFQHLAFYLFRAVETDRYVLRAANTGISAIIDPRGRLVARTSLFREDALKGRFAMNTTITPYVRFGDWFIAIAFLLLALLVTTSFVRERKRSRRV